jgi:hypothetical protein
MVALRGWLVLGALAFVASEGPAQTCDLTEPVKVGDCFDIQLKMKVEGTLNVKRDSTPVKLPLQADAQHHFSERVLAVTPGGVTEKAARNYSSARILIHILRDRMEHSLRPDRRLIVAQRHKDECLVYSPAGALTRQELDLTQRHFDTLFIMGLLAGKQVGVGDTWAVAPHVAQAMGNYEGVVESDLTGKVARIDEAVAVFSVSGKVTGVDSGALVKSTVEATGKFDRATHCLVELEWKQKDDREQGPVSPASSFESVNHVVRKKIDQPEQLNDVALISVPEGYEPPLPMTQLEHSDAKGRFSLLHLRNWHIVGQTDNHIVFRLLDRGSFIAQATIAPWKSADPGKHMTPEEFIEQVNKTPNWQPAETPLQAGEVPSTDKRWIFRYSTLGQLAGEEVLQNFYLVAAPTGEQVAVTFTLTPKQAEKLAAADLSFVGNLTVPAEGK